MNKEVLEQTEVVAQGVKRVGTLVILWGTSWSLQEIAAVISIIAGGIGILYSLSLCIKLWWELFDKWKAASAYKGEIDG